MEAWVFGSAAAQTGRHEDGRSTYGHSLVIDPWGEALLDMGTEPGVALCEIDMARVEDVRGRVPAIRHRRRFSAPVQDRCSFSISAVRLRMFSRHGSVRPKTGRTSGGASW